MRVRSVSPLRAAGLEWQGHNGGALLTVVAKATFDLLPSESRLAERQDDIAEENNHWNDDDNRSIYAPSDLAPFKPRADVLLVGHAFAPRGEPARHLIARVVVGDVDKAIDVVGERHIGPDGEVRDGARFVKMPLRYERAAGGLETRNPVGVRLDAQDGYGRTMLPNLQPPGTTLSGRGDFIEPIGFGPLAPMWSERRDKLGPLAKDWSPASWWRAPLPESFDFSFFNVAPRDQQVASLRDDERIVLENLSVEHPRLVTSLPGIHPKAFAFREGAPPFPIRMACDTLWIDTDRGVATLTWRGQLPLDRSAGTKVIVAMEEKGQTISWADIEPLVERPPASAIDGPRSREEARRAEAEMERTIAPDSDAGERTLLPFARAAREAEGMPFSARRASTIAMPAAARVDSAPSEPGPNRLGAAPSWLAPGKALTSPQPQARHDAGGSGLPPPRPLTAAPAPGESPWAAQPQRGATPASWIPPGQGPLPQRASAPPPAALPERPWMQPPPPAPVPAAVAHEAQAALGGVAAASDAAASFIAPVEALGAASPPVQARSTLREYVEVLWFDADRLRLVRGQRAFKDALAKKGGDDDWLDAAEAAPEPQEEKDRRDVYRVLSRGRPVDAEGIAQAFVDAAEAEVFDNPVVLVGGELQFHFDEVETLKTILGIATPLAGADKRMRDAIDAAAEIVKGRCSASIADGSTARIREAFAQSNRTLPATYLDATAERVLLEERHYQKRTMLGERRIRAMITPGGATSVIPLYLPEALEKKLPIFPRLRVNVVVQAVGQQDQNETHPIALVALALGRVLPIPGRGALR